MKLRQTIENIPQQEQTQKSLEWQLNLLRVAANKLGLYDAADFLTKQDFPKACFEYVQERQKNQTDLTKKLIKENRAWRSIYKEDINKDF